MPSSVHAACVRAGKARARLGHGVRGGLHELQQRARLRHRLPPRQARAQRVQLGRHRAARALQLRLRVDRGARGRPGEAGPQRAAGRAARGARSRGGLALGRLPAAAPPVPGMHLHATGQVRTGQECCPLARAQAGRRSAGCRPAPCQAELPVHAPCTQCPALQPAVAGPAHAGPHAVSHGRAAARLHRTYRRQARSQLPGADPPRPGDCQRPTGQARPRPGGRVGACAFRCSGPGE